MNVRISPEAHEAARHTAAAMGMPLGELVELALVSFMADKADMIVAKAKEEAREAGMKADRLAAIFESLRPAISEQGLVQ